MIFINSAFAFHFPLAAAAVDVDVSRSSRLVWRCSFHFGAEGQPRKGSAALMAASSIMVTPSHFLSSQVRKGDSVRSS